MKKIIVISLLFFIIMLSFPTISAQEDIRLQILTNQANVNMSFVLDNDLPRYILNEVFYVDGYVHTLDASYQAWDASHNAWLFFSHWERYDQTIGNNVRVENSSYLTPYKITVTLIGSNDIYTACYTYSNPNSTPTPTQAYIPPPLPTETPISTLIPTPTPTSVVIQELFFTIDPQTTNTLILIIVAAVIIVIVLNVLSSKEQMRIR